MMDTTSALAVEGAPYVIDILIVEGRVRSTDNLVDVGQTGAAVDVDRIAEAAAAPEPAAARFDGGRLPG